MIAYPDATILNNTYFLARYALLIMETIVLDLVLVRAIQLASHCLPIMNCPQIFRLYTIWAKNFYAIILPSLLLVGSFGDAFPSDEIGPVLMRNTTVTGIIMLSRPDDIIITTLEGYNLYASAAFHIHSDTDPRQVARFLSSVRARVPHVCRTMCLRV
jgi:hypothetical protein